MAEIERVVGNQYNRLLRQQQDQKALSASKGTVTANRGKGKNRRPHHKFEGNCFNCGKKGHCAGDCRSAKKSGKSGDANDKKGGGGSGRCYICGSEENFAHRYCGLYKSLEHRTRDCEERGAEKGAMLAKLTVPAVPEGLFSATGVRRIPRQEVALGENLTENGLVRIASGTALAMRAGVSRGVVEVPGMLAHPSEDITRKTAEMVGFETTGQWGACETCFQAKPKRQAVPKKTDERASVRGQKFFVDVGGPTKHSSPGGNSYVVTFVDDCTRFKVVKFVKKKSDTTAALLSLLADYTTPQKLSIKCVRTNNGGEFEGEFQRKLDRRSFTHKHTPPDTPQYNGVAERALGLLREKAITLKEELNDVINVPRDKLWAQARFFACDVTNKSVMTSTDGDQSPYELWFRNFPTADYLRSFGAVGYARRSVCGHKMAPKR